MRMWVVVAVGVAVGADAAEEYRAERAKAEASAPLLPAFPLATADATFRRAEQARAAGRPDDARRLTRTARSQLPFAPPALPPHLAQILGNPRWRHGDWVSAVGFSPDGKLVASAGRDRLVRVWATDTGRLIHEYAGHGEWVRAVVFLRDGRVASAGGKEIHLWSVGSAKPDKTLTGATGYLKTLAVHPRKPWILAGGEDRVARVWDAETGQEAFSLGVMSSMIESVAWGRDGGLAAAVTGEGGLIVWSADGPERKKVLEQRVMNGGAAHGVAFHPDQKTIAVCGERVARLIVLPNPGEPTEAAGAIRRTYEGALGHTDLVTCLAFSHDGKTLATAGRDQSVRLWDVSSGQPTRVLSGHGEEVSAVAFAPDGKRLASVGQDQAVRVWDLEPTLPDATLAGHAGAIWAVAASPDGARVATGGADRTVRVWDAAGQLIKSWQAPAAVLALSWLPDGLAGGCADKSTLIWDAATGAVNARIPGQPGQPLAVAAAPDGKRIAVGGGDRVVRIYDRASGQLQTTGPTHAAAVMAVAWRADGGELLSGGADGTIRVWDVAAGREIAGWRAHDAGGANAVAFSPDGTRIITVGGDRFAKVWQLPVGSPPEPRAKLAGSGGPLSALAVSPDGRLLATGGADGVVRVWDLNNRSEALAFRGHDEWVTGVTFVGGGVVSVDAGGRGFLWPLDLDRSDGGATGHARAVTALAATDGTLVSGSQDRTAIVWDPATGRPRRVAPPQSARVTAVAVAARAAVFATASEDRRVRLWDRDSGRELRAVELPERTPAIACSADGKAVIAWLLPTGSDAEVKSVIARFPADGGPQEELVSEPGRGMACLAFSGDGTLAAVGGPDGKLRVWSLESRKQLTAERTAHGGPVADVAVSPDRKTVISIDEAGLAKVWPAGGGDAAADVATGVSRLAGVAADNARFAVCSADGAVAVYDFAGKAVRNWTVRGKPAAIAFPGDGRRLAVGLSDGTIFLLELP